MAIGPTLWRVKTRLGYYARTTPGLLTRKLVEHPDLKDAGNLKAKVGLCLRKPVEVRESTSENGTHLYYLPFGDKFFCVTVLYRGNQSFIKTLHLAKKIRVGNVLYNVL